MILNLDRSPEQEKLYQNFLKVLPKNYDPFLKENYLKNKGIYRGDTCGVIHNKFPYPEYKEHILIYPFKATDKLSDLDDQTKLELMDLLAFYSDLLVGSFVFFRSYGNKEKSVKHLHFHLISPECFLPNSGK